MKRVLVSGALAALALAALALVPAAAKLSKELRTQTMLGVVHLVAADIKGDTIMPVCSGSGTILTPDGAILTNYHVVCDESAHRCHDLVAVGRFKSFSEQAEYVCFAKIADAVLDEKLDLALLKCQKDIQGRPYEPSGWPTVPVGRSEEVTPGDEITVVGYPGVGGATIHVTAGQVSGFVGETGGPGRAWMKTDANIGHGNSGGTAVDENGALIGVPTAVKHGAEDRTERVGLVRPVEHARPLIDRAVAGFEPASAAAPSGCPVSAGVTLTGRVVDGANGEPVAGAYVIVLRPGVRRGDIGDDYSGIEGRYLSFGVSDEEGAWSAVCPVPRDAKMSVLAVAADFVETYGEDILDTTGAPAVFAPWGGPIRMVSR